MRKIQIAFLMVGLLSLPAEGQAQAEHVYLIKMFDCAHKPFERSQTGFRVRGEKGIVTALHGVAGCKKIMATNRKGRKLSEPLTIKKIDTDSDMALLLSEELKSAKDEGLEVAGNIASEYPKEVRIYGHPYGISNLTTTLALRDPPFTELRNLLPADILSNLKDRSSPNHRIKVLSIEGIILPGHSGAPIVNSQGQVVAVANGGLKGGFAGIAWAVPFQDIRWEGIGSGDRLKALVRLNPDVLFKFDALVGETEVSRDDFCENLSQIIKAGETGFTSIVDKPLVEPFTGARLQGFRSKIELPGTLYSRLFPKDTVFFAMHETDLVETGEIEFYSLLTKLENCFPSWERIDESGGSFMTYFHKSLRPLVGTSTCNRKECFALEG